MARRLTRREQKIMVICFTLVLVYGGYNGIYKPFMEKAAQLDADIIRQQSRLSKETRSLRQSGEMQSAYENFRAQFKQDKTNEQVMSAILSEIEEVASELDLRISDLKPKRVQNENFYNRFSVSLTIDSDFPKVMEFLYYLQKDPHLFDVEEVRFDKGSRRRSSEIKTSLVLGRILVP